MISVRQLLLKKLIDGQKNTIINLSITQKTHQFFSLSIFLQFKDLYLNRTLRLSENFFTKFAIARIVFLIRFFKTIFCIL